MKNIVVGFSYVDYKDRRRKIAQDNAIEVLSQCPSHVVPVSFAFKRSDPHKYLSNLNITQLSILNRDSSVTINNTRQLPYIKEMLNYCSKIDCRVFGYINSDILMPDDAYSLLNMDFDAYVFSRSDIKEISPDDFRSSTKNIEVIYGGNTHAGADGFFFKKSWWECNKDRFHNDLVLGETEWDTCYRTVIKKSGARYIEARVLYHVYHDAKWDINSPGGINNLKIYEGLCR